MTRRAPKTVMIGVLRRVVPSHHTNRAAEHGGAPRSRHPHPSEVSKMAKKNGKQGHHHAAAQAPAAGGRKTGGPPAKMKTKEYEREMRVLHGELVAMQEWVKATGAKICIVFEGRDTAGKGGTI